MERLTLRTFPEESQDETVFLGFLKDNSLAVASRKLKFLTGKHPPQFIYLLVTETGLSLLFDTTSKSRALNIIIKRSSFSQFELDKERFNYETLDGNGYVCRVAYAGLQNSFRKQEVQSQLVLTTSAVLLRHQYSGQKKIEVLTATIISDMKSVPLIDSQSDHAIAQCIPESSLEPLRTLEYLGPTKINITTEENKLIFTREDQEANGKVKLIRQISGLPAAQTYLWADILFLISLTRASDKSPVTIRFYPNRLQATADIAEAHYLLTVAQARQS